MYDKRMVGRIYADRYAREDGFESYVFNYPRDILSINVNDQKIELRNGDHIYFILIRSESDVYRINGHEFNSIYVHEAVDPGLHVLIRSRLRGVGEVDPDITIFGGE